MRRAAVIFTRPFKARYTHWQQSRIRQRVAVDVVAKVEHVQLGRLIRQINRVEFDFVAMQCEHNATGELLNGELHVAYFNRQVQFAELSII